MKQLEERNGDYHESKITTGLWRRRQQHAGNAKEHTVSVGGGAVQVVMTGKKELKALTIKPEVVDPEDIEMLQDLVISAVNEVIREIEDESAKEMEKISGGLSVPGLF